MKKYISKLMDIVILHGGNIEKYNECVVCNPKTCSKGRMF